MNRRLLVTSALPYANGHIHIGHLVEYLQTDMWVRFQRLRGNECRYFCADDTHGTAIMIRARAEGRSETDLIADMNAAHQADFAKFDIHFDHYGSTNSDSNRAICEDLWQRLHDNHPDLIVKRSVERLYDPEAGTFLADRFVKGTCPKCKAPDQYGDSCDKCGATYAATELIDPYSTHSGAKPELRESQQLFVQIEQLHDWLTEYTQNGDHLQDEIANYLKGHFLDEPLRDWDVSRPAPYFGFEIPGHPGNYWYVWFDAPVGYIASCKDWCQQNGHDFSEWWGPAGDSNANTEIHHFIGKDITYFHTLFWPGVLKAAGYKLPDRVQIHGFLTVDNEKMSKSKGTFIQASTYAEHLDAAYLRYFYASKLNHKVDDLDLSIDEFIAKVNSDLVGKVVNLASRTAKFVKGETLTAPDHELLTACADARDTIAGHYEACNFAAAMREIMALADRANEFIEDAAPWTLKKDEAKRDELIKVCTIGLSAYWELVTLLAPVLPQLTRDSAALFNIDAGDQLEHLSWGKSLFDYGPVTVQKFKHLMQRVDPKKVQAMIDDTKTAAAEAEAAQAPSSPTLDAEPLADECVFDDFTKVDLRVAEVVAADHVKGADKLLQVTLSLGGDVTRQVFAGIKSAYKPEDLIGRQVLYVANLAPRKMKFGVSEGMIAAAGPGGEEIFLLSPDQGAQPGQRVH